MAGYRADMSLNERLSAKPRRKKQADYQPQIDVDKFLRMVDQIEASPSHGLPDSLSDGAPRMGEPRMPFPEFLKKKTFEEFRVNHLLEQSKSMNEPEVLTHKTPVGPWAGNAASAKTVFSENPNEIEQSRRKAVNTGSLFNREHHSNVIGKYGGFSTGTDELRRAKQAALIKDSRPEYQTLYEDNGLGRQQKGPGDQLPRTQK